jgi:tol-pal system protein YbgF
MKEGVPHGAPFFVTVIYSAPGFRRSMRVSGVMHMTRRMTVALAALFLVSTAPAVAADSVPLRPVVVAGLFGESDEDKAARLKAEQRENDQDAAIADLRQRLGDLEHALQQSTGQNEELAHRIQELSARIDRQQKDFDYKLCSLAAQQLGTSTSPDSGGLPCDPNAAAGTPAAPPGGRVQSSGPAPAGGGTLGTLPAGAPENAAKPQFDEAMNLLARARYDDARAAFRTFADANPKDPQAPQAIYWVGNIAYVQKDYTGAAQAFTEQLKKYPSSSQSPESMLKLGLSLIQLGEKKEGCLTLGAIKAKYRQAPAAVLSQAATARANFCAKD